MRAFETQDKVAIKTTNNDRVTSPEVQLVRIESLKPSKRNARTHSKKQIRQIADSMRHLRKWTHPLLVDENGNLIAGHARLMAARDLGLKFVPVIVMDGLSDAEKRALALADNKIPANAGWDRKLLAAELGELSILLPECNLSLEITGFEAGEIDSLMGDFIDAEVEPTDFIPAIESNAISRTDDYGRSVIIACYVAIQDLRAT